MQSEFFPAHQLRYLDEILICDQDLYDGPIERIEQPCHTQYASQLNGPLVFGQTARHWYSESRLLLATTRQIGEVSNKEVEGLSDAWENFRRESWLYFSFQIATCCRVYIQYALQQQNLEGGCKTEQALAM